MTRSHSHLIGHLLPCHTDRTRIEFTRHRFSAVSCAVGVVPLPHLARLLFLPRHCPFSPRLTRPCPLPQAGFHLISAQLSLTRKARHGILVVYARVLGL